MASRSPISRRKFISGAWLDPISLIEGVKRRAASSRDSGRSIDDEDDDDGVLIPLIALGLFAVAAVLIASDYSLRDIWFQATAFLALIAIGVTHAIETRRGTSAHLVSRVGSAFWLVSFGAVSAIRHVIHSTPEAYFIPVGICEIMMTAGAVQLLSVVRGGGG